MDVDEDYDDSGEDEKKAGIPNGSGPASNAGDSKTAASVSAGVNGVAGPTSKVD